MAELLRDTGSEFDPQVQERPTGFSELDRITGGFRAGQVWILTGAPGQGRTTLVTQWASQLALAGLPSWLACPREPENVIVARLLASVGRRSLHNILRDEIDPVWLERARDRLVDAPLSVEAAAEKGMWLAVEGDESVLLSPAAVLIDDADLSGGVFVSRVRDIAARGVLVILTFPRHLLVGGTPRHRWLEPEWARVADVVIEVRQATWPDETDSLRPAEADLFVLKNRWGPTMGIPILYNGHFARFDDINAT